MRPPGSMDREYGVVRPRVRGGTGVLRWNFETRRDTMTKRTTATVLACAVLAVLTGCTSSKGATIDDPTATATTVKPADVSEHESGPESPITYGFEVPRGATQLGPLVRFRSARLIAAYQPELDAAIAQKAAE